MEGGAMNIPRILVETQRFMGALEELGFGDDGDISGADTVDVINDYLPLLRHLPALAQLATHADLLVRCGGGHNHRALAQALNELKGG
jgi:hypothetical protein